MTSRTRSATSFASTWRKWLRDHEKGTGGAAFDDLDGASAPEIMSAVPSPAPPEAPPPNFRFWIYETRPLA
jgi:hypothetical protein